ncbi:MAG: ATP-binding cassette domain-containing protein [Saprospiraceae bacterium]|nr:ATP-binding cassette domain-containing protein [Lewinella sp.]
MNQHPSVISIDNLHFGYAHHQLILDRLQMEVPQGAIYGFLGANGAGKSTTIRSVLGLLKPRKGRIFLFGKEVDLHREEVLRRLGCLIEAPSIYPHLSGWHNLEVICRYLKIPTQRISEVLELVHLTGHAGKKTKKYSTGMKQRLGMAMALLSDPDLLILDEPTNGLDPTGMIEFREILEQLHSQGKTIFLSSHLLGEIEKIATHVGILKDGMLLFQGTIGELKERKSGEWTFKLETSDPTATLAFLQEKQLKSEMNGNGLLITLSNKEDLPLLVGQLVGQGIQLHEVSPVKDDLEKLFIHLTKEQ